MSEPTPQPPPPSSPPPPFDLAYQTPPPYGNAPTLVRLAAIFTFVSAGIDFLYAIVAGVAIGFLQYVVTHVPPPAPPIPGAPPAPPPPAMPPIILYYAMYGIPALLCLVALGFKIFGAIKLLRRGPRAWGWGLAIAIIGATQFWMFLLCCLFSIIPVGVGIYSIVILCLPVVRTYLREPEPTASV